MDYFVGEENITVNIDADLNAEIYAANLGKCSHTGLYEDLDDKLVLEPKKSLTVNSKLSGITEKNPSSGTLSWSIAKEGYTPLMVLGFDSSNYTSSAGVSRVTTTGIYLKGNTAYWTFRALGRSNAKNRKYQVNYRILYVKNVDVI